MFTILCFILWVCVWSNIIYEFPTDIGYKIKYINKLNARRENYTFIEYVNCRISYIIIISKIHNRDHEYEKYFIRKKYKKKVKYKYFSYSICWTENKGFHSKYMSISLTHSRSHGRTRIHLFQTMIHTVKRGSLQVLHGLTATVFLSNIYRIIFCEERKEKQ